jgi:hypothetical protein
MDACIQKNMKLNKFYLLLFVLLMPKYVLADSFAIFTGKSVNSNLIDLPKKTIENNLEFENYKLMGLNYQKSVSPMLSTHNNIEFLLVNHDPDHLIETAIAYQLQTDTYNIANAKFRLGLSLGLSYIHGEPIFEDGTKDNPDKKYRLLNYNAYEISFLDQEEINSFYFRIHHRSGVYGLIAPQHVGSNFITVGLRRNF